jgi:transcriptional regulator with XRE-family HTH domain
MLIAKMLRTWRESQKLSVRQMAKVIGVGHTVLWRFENGQDINSAQWVKIIRHVLTE